MALVFPLEPTSAISGVSLDQRMTTVRRNRLRWRCRRGMLELDLILAKILEPRLEHFSDAELTLVERLLDLEDTTLFDCLHGSDPLPETELQNFVDKLRQ